MARPFRTRPPVPLRVIRRARLLDAVSARWQVRVVALVAGPGFGKTSLLSEAWEGPQPSGAAQYWLTCEPADHAADSLRTDIAVAIGVPENTDTRGILDALWSRSPAPICLVFDDAHEIPFGSPGAMWLATFIEEMSANVHVVMAARARVPVPLSRLTAQGQVVRITESDMLFDPGELEAFAADRGASVDLLAGSGGWPALAELAVSAGDDLRIDFLREEVLLRLGTVRSRQLARFAACGGGDDEVVAALDDDLLPEGIPATGGRVDRLVEGVPLVSRSSSGWAMVHPLWDAALARLLSEEETRRARLDVARVHLANGRFSIGIGLLAQAAAWDAVFTAVADAEQLSVFGTSPFERGEADNPLPRDFGRWYRLLPTGMRDHPVALLAEGIELQSSDPLRAAALFRAARDRFRVAGDVRGELATISREGIVHWWRNDMAALMELYGRVIEMAAAGSDRAQVLAAVGLGAVAHLQGDSAAVLAALGDVGADADRGWLPSVRWLRSVAHRRAGDLVRARRELELIGGGSELADPQIDVAMLRIRWLAGDVEEAASQLVAHYEMTSRTTSGFLVREACLEAAAKTAWLGDADAAEELLANAPPVDEVPNPLAVVLESIARAAIALERDDEAAAVEALSHAGTEGPTALGSPGGWYWRDRAALVVLRTLLPELRAAAAAEPRTGCHASAAALGDAIEAVRTGDSEYLERFDWPAAGVVRAHLPHRWVAELVAAGAAAGNPAPLELARAARHDPRRSVVSTTDATVVIVMGPMRVVRAGITADSPHLQRVRVRELLSYLVALRHVHREVVAETLWPDTADPAHNLRVTLSYLRHALEGPAADRTPWVTATREWLTLDPPPSAAIDVWMLEDLLDRAEHAERTTDVRSAIDLYRRTLPAWSGTPFADVLYAPWAEGTRQRVTGRYVNAALRAGELWLSARELADATMAAQCALNADRYCEPAHRLLIRTYLAQGNRGAALDALRTCGEALAELGLRPEPATLDLLLAEPTTGNPPPLTFR